MGKHNYIVLDLFLNCRCSRWV